MDTMGALALATESPSMELLKQPPNGHEAALINRSMWKHILVQGIYQVNEGSGNVSKIFLCLTVFLLKFMLLPAY